MGDRESGRPRSKCTVLVHDHEIDQVETSPVQFQDRYSFCFLRRVAVKGFWDQSRDQSHLGSGVNLSQPSILASLTRDSADPDLP